MNKSHFELLAYFKHLASTTPLKYDGTSLLTGVLNYALTDVLTSVLTGVLACVLTGVLTSVHKHTS